MNSPRATESGRNDAAGVYYAPLEKSFDHIISPFEQFIHRQTTSGVLLMVTAVMALVLANSAFGPLYEKILHVPLALELGTWSIGMSLHHWVNDGLMAFFFFVVGLELKRELLVGELASLRKAMLPVIAAAGGMIVPALIYTMFNYGGPGEKGWGIAMATDIAFAIGVLVLLAHRVPRALITFLVALAIADDLGAVVVIALFYTADLSLPALAVAAGLVGVLTVFNLAGIRRITPYFAVAICLWYALYLSGVHPTLAGVLGAFTVPSRPKYDPAHFSSRTRALLCRFDESYKENNQIVTNDELHSTVQAMESAIMNVITPLQRLDRIWHLPVAYLVIPIFALFNAGISLDMDAWAQMLAHPVFLGVTVGLVAGKFIGIAGASWIALKLRLADLPEGTSFSQIVGVALLAGIGFTMSMFIAQLSFTDEAALLAAKAGILLASMIAGIGGMVWLWLVGAKRTP